jgi:DNA polymerase III delta prime subunit
VVVGECESGVTTALEHIEKELGLRAQANPDVIVFRYNLLAIEDVRKIIAVAGQAPLGGDKKAIVILTSRMYHEAQNALLKLFEEPPRGTILYLVIPEKGQLLPTLRSRVFDLKHQAPSTKHETIILKAQNFIKMNAEDRSVYIKKLTSATDDEDKREARDEALALINGIEAAAARHLRSDKGCRELLEDIALLRGYMHDRSASVKMILEHLALTIPKALAK